MSSGELTRHGRAKFTVSDFPLGVEAYMRTKNVNMCVRTTMGQAWYKSLLKTGVFGLVGPVTVGYGLKVMEYRILVYVPPTSFTLVDLVTHLT